MSKPELNSDTWSALNTLNTVARQTYNFDPKVIGPCRLYRKLQELRDIQTEPEGDVKATEEALRVLVLAPDPAMHPFLPQSDREIFVDTVPRLTHTSCCITDKPRARKQIPDEHVGKPRKGCDMEKMSFGWEDSD